MSAQEHRRAPPHLNSPDEESPQDPHPARRILQPTYTAADQNGTGLKSHQFWDPCKWAGPPSHSPHPVLHSPGARVLWTRLHGLTQAGRRGSRRLNVRAGFSPTLVNGKYLLELRQGFKNQKNCRSKGCTSARFSLAKYLGRVDGNQCYKQSFQQNLPRVENPSCSLLCNI